jgi:hypothetical protein
VTSFSNVSLSGSKPVRTRKRGLAKPVRREPPAICLASRLARISPAFIQINELKHRLHRSRRQPNLSQPFMQSLRARIAPAAFGHKCVPDFDFFLARLPAIFECPRQQFLVNATLERFLFERRVINMEKSATTGVETILHFCPPRCLPALRQFARCRNPNLVQHAAKINHAFDLLEWASQPRNNSWIGICHG